ncbi:MAG: hypothetical protein M1504_01245 [Candidatus Marsarchaeota archaeon]|nr:hypothetical protein [Candidatus Marsarchaeota archaeon]
MKGALSLSRKPAPVKPRAVTEAEANARIMEEYGISENDLTPIDVSVLPNASIQKFNVMEQELGSFLVPHLSTFRQKVCEPGLVLYPCSGIDASPGIVFGKERTTFVDMDEEAVKRLKADGFNAVCQDIKDFKPGYFSLLILSNPSIRASIVLGAMAGVDFIVANNYHGTARELFNEHEKFRLMGVITDGGMSYTKDILGKYKRSLKRPDVWPYRNSEDYFVFEGKT